MKDSSKYSGEIQKFYRSLKRKYPKVKKAEYENIVESLIHGSILEHVSESVVQSVFRKFDNHFVDFNDVRVSRPEEIVEMLGEDSEGARKAAAAAIRILGGIFRRYNNLDLSGLRKSGKRQARVTLEKIDGTSNFCVDYCVLTALRGHAVPLTEGMIKFLRENDLVHLEADNGEIAGFLTRQISAANAYEFYALLRRQTESKRGVRRRTAAGTGVSAGRPGTRVRKKK